MINPSKVFELFNRFVCQICSIFFRRHRRGSVKEGSRFLSLSLSLACHGPHARLVKIISLKCQISPIQRSNINIDHIENILIQYVFTFSTGHVCARKKATVA